MAEQTTLPMDEAVTVELAPNAMHAVLRLKPGMDGSQLTEQTCIERLLQAGVAESCIPSQSLAECVKRYRDDSQVEQTLELNGRPVIHGTNGYLQWHDGMDPTHRFDDCEAGQVDHYNRSAFVTVGKDQPFARIFPPTEGEAGMDLRGVALAPNPGKPAAVSLAPSVHCGEDGICRAAQPGVIMMDGQTLRIDPLLAIPASVDFSTGNIRFEGDVQIGGGVCDRFVVRATGSVEVKQLIEAAALDVGKDLRALGGMAAKEKGHVRVGGHMIARYLDNVVGSIGGNLEVEREVIGCELNIGGVVQLPKGALLGGVLRCGDSIHVGRVGSMAAVATVVDMGHVPALEQNIAQQEQQRREVAEAMTQLQAMLDAVGEAASPALLDRRMKLLALDHQLETRLDMLRSQLEKQRKIDLNVALYIGPGVTFICGNQVVAFLDQVRGPLHIGRNEQGMLTLSVAGGEHRPMADLPQVRAMVKPAPKEKNLQPA